MRSIISKFYLFGFIFTIIIALGLFFQFSYFSNILKEDSEVFIAQSRDLIGSEINSILKSKGQVIEDAADFVAIEKWDNEQLLAYLKKLMLNNPMFTSIYYASINNTMVNASGWVPPSTFDLRTRPWYIKAVNERKLIFTEAFVNASKDKLIITIAKPIYNSDKQLIGVVAGDVSIKDILTIIDNKKIKGSGYSFLIDGKGNILAHPNYEYNFTSKLKNINEISGKLNEELLGNKLGETKALMDGIEGYLAYRAVENTDWIIGSFIPKNEYTKRNIYYLRISVITLISSLIIFVILLWLQRKYFIKPIYLLDKDVQEINIEENIAYRVPMIEKDPFTVLRKSINTVLCKAQEFFSQLEGEEEKLKQSLERNSAIVNAIPDLLFVVDNFGNFLDCMTSDEEQLYTPKSEFTGKTIWEVMPKEIADKGYEKICVAIKTGVLQSFEYELDMPQGKQNYEIRIIKSRDSEVIAISRNITERKKMEQKLDYLSYHDQLTGLYNRRFFEEELKRLDVKENLPLTLVMADVNGLKLINDSFGHKIGDELLTKIAEVIKSGCRANDVISRIGGDEFIILLPHIDSIETEKIIKRIRDMSSREKVASIDLSISFGWETKYSEEEDISEVLKKAEDYMYTRKLFEGPSMRSRTIETIIRTLHEKNKREEQHSQRVSLICRNMGYILGLSEGEIKELENIGLLHDIGKIAIDESILNKADKIKDDEWDEIKRHPEIGYRILNTVSDMAEMAEIVLSHHERWDGTGYPKGLKGKEIPFKSRIISIADSYDAMISDRAYRKALTEDAVVQEFKKNAGVQFDPELAKIFVEKIMKKAW